MKIGIDLSPLQGDHRMRGIGYTLLNFVNNISASDRTQSKFVFYLLATDKNYDPLPLLNLKGMDYELRYIKPRRTITKRLPGRLSMATSAINQLIELRDYHFGDSRITDLRDVEAFLQSDQSQSLPHGKGIKKSLIVYDIIPYVLSWDYLWSYGDARKKGFSRKAGVRYQARRWLYAHKLKVNTSHATNIISISEHTKRDFNKYLSVPKNRITVVLLGVTMPDKQIVAQPKLRRYIPSSWGYIRRPFAIDPAIPFILFVGGADRRRRLDDLVAALNKIRSQGRQIKLVLAGDSMQGPDKIATLETQKALKSSPYQDDIIFLGFVDDITRDWLYLNASAFVFPSLYEGFGLPVLEAMSYGTPVIAYANPVIQEVAGDVPVYASDAASLTTAILTQLGMAPGERQQLGERSIEQASRYSWKDASTKFMQCLNSRKAE